MADFLSSLLQETIYLSVTGFCILFPISIYLIQFLGFSYAFLTK